MAYFAALSQNVQTDPNNKSTANIANGATWNSAGTGTSTLGVAGIQVNVKMDRDGIIYIEQGPSSSVFNVIDTYKYYNLKGGMSITVQATDAFVRVRVKNTGPTSTTAVAINTYLCPIVEALPRSLDEDGNLKVGVKSIQDEYGFGVENTFQGEMRTVIPNRLVGASFIGTTIDPNFWTSTPTNSATIAQDHGQIVLSSGVNAAGSAILQTNRVARFVGGSTMRYRANIYFSDAGIASNVKRWGVFDGNNGLYFKLSGTSLYACNMITNGAEQNAIISTSWSNNNTLPDLTTINTYEIYWSSTKAYFVINGILMHILNFGTVGWTDNYSLPARSDNINAGSTTNSTMTVRTATIYRLGKETTRPLWKYIHGTLTATILKYGAGVLHSISVNAHGNGGTISLYDALSAINPIALIAPPNGIAPFTQTFGPEGITFYTGLTVVVGSAAAEDVTIVYE